MASAIDRGHYLHGLAEIGGRRGIGKPPCGYDLIRNCRAADARGPLPDTKLPMWLMMTRASRRASSQASS